MCAVITEISRKNGLYEGEDDFFGVRAKTAVGGNGVLFASGFNTPPNLWFDSSSSAV